MANRLRIYVSAAADLEAEREAVGKAVASLPISLGWVINFTRARGESLAPALPAVDAAHFYVLLLGADIRAPVGSELIIARRTTKKILPFVKDVTRTPAARVFVKDIALEWKSFATAAQLGFLLRLALAEQISARAETYGLSVLDWEMLSALLSELRSEEGMEENQELPPGYRGAGKDGVIVSATRDLPADGVLIDEPAESS